MLKQITVSAIVISSFLSPSSALADHEPTTSNASGFRVESSEKRAEIKSNIESKREEIKTKIQEKREEIKVKFNEKRTEAAKKIIERQTKHADFLSNIASRINTKLTELKNASYDTALAQANLDAAQANLDAAKTSIDNSTTILNGITSDNIAIEFPRLKDAIRTTHEKLVLTQQNLRKSINELKKISEPQKKDDVERSTKQ